MLLSEIPVSDFVCVCVCVVLYVVLLEQQMLQCNLIIIIEFHYRNLRRQSTAFHGNKETLIQKKRCLKSSILL